MTMLNEGFRSIDLEGNTHDIDETRHSVVVDFPFERLDSYRSDFGKGWCDEYLGSHKPVMLVHHNPSDLIGHGIGYQNLGDRAQLIGQFSDFDSVPLAKRYFAHVRDGDIPGWSFHYRNARGIPHPSGQRGAVRYTKADMPEFGPTPFPAIPGAGAVGLRSEDTLTIPTLAELTKLLEIGRLDDDGFRSAMLEYYPTLGEHISVQSPPAPTAEQTAAAALEAVTQTIATHGMRSMTITIGDDGSVTTGDGSSVGGDDDTDPPTLAAAVDSCLDEAVSLIGDTDTTTLPDNIQQALSLTQAAGVAVDELLDAMGVDDPDAGSGSRSLLGTADRNDLPDSAFAYIESGGTKDADGKTVPRSKRHFPIQDVAHVRNALARIGQGADFADQAKPKVMAAAKKFKIDTDGSRSDEPNHATEAAAALARMRLRTTD